MPVKKKPSAAQLAARAKFVKMVRAKAAAKKVAGLDKVTRKGKKTTVSYSRVSGVKKYDYNQLENITLTRVNNDVNGNPRYVLHFLEVLNKEEQAFLPFSKKYEYALKKAKVIGGRKFHNKQYGGGIVFQSYNTDNLKENIIDVLETTPKIKY